MASGGLSPCNIQTRSHFSIFRNFNSLLLLINTFVPYTLAPSTSQAPALPFVTTVHSAHQVSHEQGKHQ